MNEDGYKHVSLVIRIIPVSMTTAFLFLITTNHRRQMMLCLLERTSLPSNALKPWYSFGYFVFAQTR